jgi:hypothetical protein
MATNIIPKKIEKPNSNKNIGMVIISADLAKRRWRLIARIFTTSALSARTAGTNTITD